MRLPGRFLAPVTTGTRTTIMCRCMPTKSAPSITLGTCLLFLFVFVFYNFCLLFGRTGFRSSLEFIAIWKSISRSLNDSHRSCIDNVDLDALFRHLFPSWSHRSILRWCFRWVDLYLLWMKGVKLKDVFWQRQQALVISPGTGIQFWK